ncbi:MAG: hypothetical protein KAJ57_12830 [Woeseiaceae bacterium]|nr:hypothetical protein [Woeseiaceae bacterium]
MWIPKPIYDHAPLFWFSLGALFLAGGLFLGLDEGLKVAYFVFAAFCGGQGTWTFFVRRRHRRQAERQTLEESVEPLES